MAVAPYRSVQSLGWMPVTPSATITNQNNAAANWFAYGFNPDSARTLSAVRVFVSAVAGTLGASDITCDLYDSTGANGAPGAAIESGKVPTATITASGWFNFTGFTTALTSGQLYWLVFKNVNGTPASNNCTFRVLSFTGGLMTGNAVNRFGWSTASSTNSGSTWITVGDRTALRVSYADGSFDGLPFSNTAAAGVGDGVYATRESGLKFTTPNNGAMNVAGLAFFVSNQTGTPTNGCRFGLWTGTTPANQGYTNTIPQTAGAGGGQWHYAYFPSDIVLQPGTVTRVTLATTGADASSNRYNNQEITWDTDANSVILLPWEGTATKTYFDGSNWTDSPLGTSLFGHALLLDTAGEFTLPSNPAQFVLAVRQS